MTEKTTPFDEEIAELKERIKAIQEAQINPLQVKLDECCRRRIEYLCPFKVGDVVTRTTKSNSTRRENTTRARVSQIVTDPETGYDAWGIRILKDGSEGREMYLSSSDHWIKYR